MSDNKEIVKKPSKIGILRKRNTSVAIDTRTTKPTHFVPGAKRNLDSNPRSARSVDGGGSHFSRRTGPPHNKPPAPSNNISRIVEKPAITASPSTATVVSRKSGIIPTYIRNKSQTKSLVAVQVQCNKKQFNQIKKELADLQKKTIEYYKRYRESLVKLNKLNGADGPLAIDELQIIDFRKQSDFTAAQPVTQSRSFNKFPEIPDEKIRLSMSQEVHGVYNFKLLRDFSKRLSTLVDTHDDTESFPAKIKNILDEIEMKILKMENEPNTVGELEEGEPKSNNWSREALLSLKHLKLDNMRLEKQLEAKQLEMIAKDKSMLEFNNTIKSLQEKVVKCSNQIQMLQSNMIHTNEKHRNELDGLKAKYDDEVEMCNLLRADMNELNLGLANDFRTVRDDNSKLKTNEIHLENEIESLKLSLNEMLQKKPKMEENVSRREMGRRSLELNRLNRTITNLKETLVKRETILAQKCRTIGDYETTIKQLETREKINEFQEEIRTLQKMISQKSEKIEQLEYDLNKSKTEFQLQQESLSMQQRLLHIRTELVESLQKNEDPNQNQISDLNSEIEKMSLAVKQLHQEISSKSEELVNPFSTMGSKNLEVKRQDHIIQMLEETHERNQKIRVKLDGRIAGLEHENSHLKRFLLELNIPFNMNTIKGADDSKAVPPSTGNFYENLRRKKRHGQTMIKVKKYSN